MLWKKDLIELLNEIFKPLGFKRKGNNWVQNGDRLVKVINLQKSNFGNYFYINYGFVIKSLKLTTQMHVDNRLASLEKSERKSLVDMLDCETKIPWQQRSEYLRSIISTKILPVMKSVVSEQDLYQYLKNRLHINDIPLIVKDYFQLDHK